MGRLGLPAKGEAHQCNFSALYDGEWREQHALLISQYGVKDEPGAWVLLKGTARSEILEYKDGKYKVKMDGVEKWMRASQLLHHSASELSEARRKARAAAEEEERAEAEEEMSTPHPVGTRLYAKGHVGGGVDAWFEAEVVSHRSSYPPIKVKYLSTLSGETSSLALPTPRTAFVPASKLSAKRPHVA